jgi:hypothetical protein
VNSEAMPNCWQQTLKQEWATAGDDQTREHLLMIYQERLAGLPQYKLEKLLAELQNLGPWPRNGTR